VTTPNPPARQVADSALQRPHILVVTADEDLKNFFVEGLVIGGLWVSVVASGIQTLEVLRLRSFDLMIIDERLSGLPALELIRRLRGRSDRAASDNPRTDVPILLLADTSDQASQLAADEAGADRVLTPPLELEELVPLLYATVGSWRQQHPDRPWADSSTLNRPEP
jgi:DNA-binding response OmpR family regulator